MADESQASIINGLLWRSKASYGLLYGGWACFLPFAVLLFEQQGMDPVQIGVLRAIGNVTSILASPLWGLIADRAGSRVGVFLSLLIAGAGMRAALLGFHTFWTLLIVMFTAEFIASPVPSQLDAAVMAVVNRSKALAASQESCTGTGRGDGSTPKRDSEGQSIVSRHQPQDYGQQRLFGAVGWGIMSPIAGALQDATGSFALSFALCAIFQCLAACFATVVVRDCGLDELSAEEETAPAVGSGVSGEQPAEAPSSPSAACDTETPGQGRGRGEQDQDAIELVASARSMRLAEARKGRVTRDVEAALGGAEEAADAVTSSASGPTKFDSQLAPGFSRLESGPGDSADENLAEGGAVADAQSAEEPAAKEGSGFAPVPVEAAGGVVEEEEGSSLLSTGQEGRASGTSTVAGSPKRSVWTQVGLLVGNPAMQVFLLVALCMGSCFGTIGGFLFVYLETQPNSSRLLFGLCLLVTCVAEVPVFHYSGRFLKYFGHSAMLAAALVAYCLRIVWYSYAVPAAGDAWMVLPAELLHGVTYGAGWAACTAFANAAAPRELQATAQGLLTGTHWGLGGAVGALIGGWLYQIGGGKLAFLGSLGWIALGLTTLMLGGWGVINEAAERGERTRQEEAAVVNDAALRREAEGAAHRKAVEQEDGDFQSAQVGGLGVGRGGAAAD